MAQQSLLYKFYIRALFVIASGLSILIYLFVYHILRYRYNIVIDNLTKSFPGKTQPQLKIYARDYYRHLGDLMVEPLLFMLVNHETRQRLAHYTNIELLGQLYERGNNLVALAAHCGNWEYYINFPKIQPFKTYTAYTPLSSKWLDQYILKLRSMYGVILFPKRNFFRGALSVLKTNDNPSMVVVIADQRPAPGSAKNFVEFLGQPTQVQIGAERLATASGAAVVYIECIKKSRFHYDYTFHIISDDASGCLPTEITNTYYRMLENNIMKSPPYWLWSHNRWKPLEGDRQPNAALLSNA